MFPQLTEERRRELVKVVKHRAEEGRVAVRNVRRQARHDLEALEKDGDISRDELDRVEKDLEKQTHDVIAEIDELLGHKERGAPGGLSGSTEARSSFDQSGREGVLEVERPRRRSENSSRSERL